MLMLDKLKEENVSTQQYIMFPLRSSIYSSYKSSNDKAEDDTINDDACKKTVQEPASEYDQALKNVLDKMMDQKKEATEQSNAVRKVTPVNTASASRNFSLVGPSSGPSFVHFGGSFPIDVANLPHDPLMPKLEDTAEIQSTGIFGNAYDNHDLETLNTPYVDQSVGAEDVDFNQHPPNGGTSTVYNAQNKFQLSSMGSTYFLLGFTSQSIIEDGISLVRDKYVGESKEFGFFSRRFQVQQVSHLNASKKESLDTKGQPKLGLWYPKDSPLILEAFSDSDYAGASLDRKSTTGGCQFLGVKG
ncbi:hypothetical protein Tco_0722582 [Tanacetum coccineum]